MPIEVRTGILCSLNKVPSLPSCFFSSFPNCRAVSTLLLFPRKISYWSSLIFSRSNSSLTTQMTSGFYSEETHSQGLPRLCSPSCWSVSVFLPAWAGRPARLPSQLMSSSSPPREPCSITPPSAPVVMGFRRPFLCLPSFSL